MKKLWIFIVILIVISTVIYSKNKLYINSLLEEKVFSDDKEEPKEEPKEEVTKDIIEEPKDVFYKIETPKEVYIAVSVKSESKYDKSIKKWSKTYLPGIDFLLLKAQFYQESRLNPLAVSPVGAAGIAQFMPATWGQMKSELNFEKSAHDPEYAIMAGAYYMGKLIKFWSSPRPFEDKIKLAQASYNAGAGNMLKAQELSENKVNFDPILNQLVNVTGRHSKETIDYIDRIWKYWALMKV